MKNFFIKLLALTILLALSLVGTIALSIWRKQDEVADLYAIDARQDVLFIGSSQIGCAVRSNPIFHHKLLWYITSTFPNFLVQLRELDRRNQLRGVKVLITNLNPQTFQQIKAEYVERTWFLTLPVTWRYCTEYPMGVQSFFWHVFSNVSSTRSYVLYEPIPDHPAISEKTKEEYDKYIAEVPYRVSLRNYTDNIPNWKLVLRHAIHEMKNICDAHDIRMVTVEMPTFKPKADALPKSDWELVKEYVSYAQSLGIQHVQVGDFTDDDFMDDVHMTRSGSEKFMRRLYGVLGISVMGE